MDHGYFKEDRGGELVCAHQPPHRAGVGKEMVLHALIALASSWWPGPRLGQGRVQSVERHQ
jgi:hypothetical protein